MGTLSGAVPGMPTAPRTPYGTNFGLLQAFALSFTWSPRGQSWIEIKLMPGKKAVALQPLCRHLLHHVLECVSQNTHTRNRVFVGVRHSRLQVVALRTSAAVLRAPLKRDDLRLNVIAFRVPKSCLPSCTTTSFAPRPSTLHHFHARSNHCHLLRQGPQRVEMHMGYRTYRRGSQSQRSKTCPC